MSINMLIFAQNSFPTIRPILNSLWNNEFAKRGHKITWIFISGLLTAVAAAVVYKLWG